MLRILITLLIFTQVIYANTINKTQIADDLNKILNDIRKNYVYLKDKDVDLICIKEKYSNKIDTIKTEEQTVLFFEVLLNEFYDSHLILNTNRNSSYRLYSPIYASLKENKIVISSVWQSQLEPIKDTIIGAEILKFNGVDYKQSINHFPSLCHDKNKPEIRQWLANKVLAGRYNQPRLLTLKLSNGKIIKFDLDKLKVKPSKGLLDSRIENNIGIIRINNSLGNSNLVTVFDKKLDEFFDTKGLIIDLRNTVDGGDSYVARGIMSRFISEDKPYQKHWYLQKSNDNPDVVRTWVEYVSPRLKIYDKPVVVLVGRWTGSMGEGLAIGFEGMDRAIIVGTEMERLAGEMDSFSFIHQKYDYRLSTAKLFHINGKPREQYTPKHYVAQSQLDKDETLNYGLKFLNNF